MRRNNLILCKCPEQSLTFFDVSLFPSERAAEADPLRGKGKTFSAMKTLRRLILLLSFFLVAASCTKLTRKGSAPVVTITADNSFYKNYGAFYLHLNGGTEDDVSLFIQVSQPKGLVLNMPKTIAIERGCAFTAVPVSADPSGLGPGIHTVSFRIQGADGAEVGEPSSADILLIVPEKH